LYLKKFCLGRINLDFGKPNCSPKSSQNYPQHSNDNSDILVSDNVWRKATKMLRALKKHLKYIRIQFQPIHTNANYAEKHTPKQVPKFR
jgi:hypothetical protein